MQQLVFISAVPDLAQAHVSKRRGVLDENAKRVMDPLSGKALEMALQLKAQAEGEVVVGAIGGGADEEVLRCALAMGADRALWVTVAAQIEGGGETAQQAGEGESCRGSITEDFLSGFVKVRLLLALLGKEQASYDLFWFGGSSVRRGFGELGPRFAVARDLPCLIDVRSVTANSDTVVSVQSIHAGDRSLEIALPGVLTVGDAAPAPRIPNALAVMKAGKKELKKYTIADLEVADEMTSWQGVETVVRTWSPEE